MIKVAFIIDTIESPTAGTEKQLLMLIKNLDRSRFAPTLFVLHSSSWLKHHFDLCPLVVIDFTSFFAFSSYRRLKSFIDTLKREGFDCLQTHFIDSNIVGIISAKAAGVPHIISSRRDQGYWHTPVKLFIFKFLNKWVNSFVANCQATATWASITEAISSERIKVIYNGIELESFSPRLSSERHEVRGEIGLLDSSIVVVIVANLRAVKQIDTFLQAAALVRLRLGDAKFLVIGDGDLREDLEKLALQLGISGETTFLGKRTDVPRILSACDVAVLSSASESFSNSIVEYFASGLPVVSTDVGGCREIIVDGINGYVVPPSDYKTMADRICELAVNVDMEGMRQINIEKAKNLFSKEIMVATFERLYAEGTEGTHLK